MESRDLGTLTTPSSRCKEAEALISESCPYKQGEYLSPAALPLSVQDIVCKSRSYNSALRSLPEDALLTGSEAAHGHGSRAPTSPKSSDQQTLSTTDAAGALPPRRSPPVPRPSVRRRSAEALPTGAQDGRACMACSSAAVAAAVAASRSQDHVRWCEPVAGGLGGHWGEQDAAAVASTPFPPRLCSKSCNPVGSASASPASASPHAPALLCPCASLPHSLALSPSAAAPAPAPHKPRMPISPTLHRHTGGHAPLSAFERLLKAVSNSEVHTYGSSFGHSNLMVPHLNSISNCASDAAQPTAGASPHAKPRSTGSLAARSHSCRAHEQAAAGPADGAGCPAARPAAAQWCDSTHQHVGPGYPPLAGVAAAQCCHGQQRRSSSVAEYIPHALGAKPSRELKAKPCDSCSSPAPKAAAAAAAGLRVDIPDERSSPPYAPVSPQCTSHNPALGSGCSSRRQGGTCEPHGRSTNRSGNLHFLDVLPELVEARAQQAAAQRNTAQHLEPAHGGCVPEPSMGMVKLMKHVRELRLEVEAFRQQNCALKVALKLEGDARGELSHKLKSAQQQLRDIKEDNEAERSCPRVGCFSFWPFSKPQPQPTKH